MPAFILPLALFLVMFGIGLSLKVDNFQRLGRRPLSVIVGSCLQLVVLPVLGFGLVTLLQLPAVYAAGIMILTFAPGGATSNLISYLCRADLALSVSLTTLASILTPFTIPLFSYWTVVYWLGQETSVDFPILLTIAKLLLISLMPVLLGMWAHHKSEGLARKARPVVKWVSILFMLGAVVGVVLSSQHSLWEVFYTAGHGVVLLSLSAMLMGWGVARAFGLSVRKGLTLAIETGLQNAGLALVVTQTILGNDQMSAVVILYGVLMQVPAMVLVIARNLPKSVLAWGGS